MPPRLNKRQLREQEELLSLEAARDPEGSSGEESEPKTSVRVKPSGSAFAAKKKKKRPAATAPTTPVTISQGASGKVDQEQPSSSPGPSKQERKALKKQKQKAKDNRDDVDKALAELSIKYPDLRQVVAATSASPAERSASSALAELLAVSLQHLDAEAEMRKFFGSKAISAAKASGSGSSSSSRRTAMQRSNLTRPQSTWSPAQMRDGLSARMYADEEVQEICTRHGWQPLLEERVWTVEYSKKYRGVTLAFMQTVMSGDPEGFWQILRLLPYHADTLLQLSEVYFHREEHSTAADHIDRALFAYERAFVGSFSFTSGVNRLDFDRVENRPFFLALHRQVSDLQRRGCVRAAFEFARLLYALDPWTDPHGALLHLDFLAHKAGMSQWLLDVWDFFATHASNEKAYSGRLVPTALPGWAYARALALYVREEEHRDKDHGESTKALQDAIIAFPTVVPVLADKADISLSADVRRHSAFRIHPDARYLYSSLPTESAAVLHLLSHLYAQRSFSLWKVPERTSWFARTVVATLADLPPSYDNTSSSYRGFVTLFSKRELTYSVYRHTTVLEASCRRLFGFIPRAVTDAKHLACDPLPPPTRVSDYDEEFFRGAEDALNVRPRSRRANERLLERLLPDPVFRGQLQAFFQAHPDFAARFPGGLIQFAQLAGQLPEEVLEDLMVAHMEGGDGVGAMGGMPGQMPGEEGMLVDFGNAAEHANAPTDAVHHLADQGHHEQDAEEDDEDDEDEDIDVAPLPVRLLRNIVNRFWGSNAHAEESSEDEDEDIAGQRRAEPDDID
ncbi:hypothetical protein IEO21_03583 [Rhodonia placenta]|uniref:DUF654-domain-containing protein n=1 Tax=Rhodonia placenta TaxID=104341 RepID=A0A8H7U3R8_9APHY|nr:hypothetical protein IEO21_03583 [Postia placenta]